LGIGLFLAEKRLIFPGFSLLFTRFFGKKQPIFGAKFEG